MALPLVKLEDIGLAFDIISGYLDSDDAVDNEDWSPLNEFLTEYVYNLLVKTGSTFDKIIWNQHANFKNRTNNHLEGWHRAFSYMRTDHPNIYELIERICKEQVKCQIESRQPRHGGPGSQRQRKKYREINKDLENIPLTCTVKGTYN